MLRVLVIFVCFTMTTHLFSQSIGVGTNNPLPSAILDVSSTTQGVLISRMTSSQRDAIVNPAQGLMILNLDDKCIDVYTGSYWTKNCGKDVDTLYFDLWTQKASYGGGVRKGASGFSIGNKGYMGTGLGITQTNDFWEYNPVSNAWTQKANFAGTPRKDAVGFSIGTKGYIGTGQVGGQLTNDFWEYDPAINTWTQKASIGGLGRLQATGWSIGDKGYIGTGMTPNGPVNDVWEYNPSANSWTQKANFGGGNRFEAIGFSIGNKGYLGTGNSGSGFMSDLWEYDPSLNTWIQKANLAGPGRMSAVGFSLAGMGFVGVGTNSSGLSDFWGYNPSTNTWTPKAKFGGQTRVDATAIVIGDRAYVGTGDVIGVSQADFWEYNPSIPYNISFDPDNNYQHSMVSLPNGDVSFGKYQANTMTLNTKLRLDNLGDLYLNSGNSYYIGGRTSVTENGARFHYNGSNAYFDVKGGSMNFRADNASGATIRMTILQTNGFVGIGTTSPQAPLHISAASEQGDPVAIKYFNVGTSAISSIPNWSGQTALLADGNICATGAFIAASSFDFSDLRIKNVIGISKGEEDLNKLSKIEITRYTHKDTLQKGSGVQTKVIAQQLESVMPEAVTTTSAVIPDIMQEASSIVSDGKGNLQIFLPRPHDLKPQDQVRIIDETGKEKMSFVISVPDRFSFTIASSHSYSKLFVYGKMVDDFRVVDYNAIAMLNVSATQVLIKEVETLKKREQQQTTIIEQQQEEIYRLQNVLEQQGKDIEARLLRLEGNIGGFTNESKMNESAKK